MAADIDLSFKLWPEIIKIIIYLYNYTPNKSILKDNGEEVINSIIFLF